MGLASDSLPRQSFQNLGGIPGHNAVRRDVPGHHAPCADDGKLTDGDSTQQGGAGADGGAPFYQSRFANPLLLRFQLSIRVGGTGIKVVDESDVVPDKDLILQGYPFADKRVTGNFAPTANPNSFLDFDKGTDFDVIANLAAIKIGEPVYANSLSELYVWCYFLMEVVLHRH